MTLERRETHASYIQWHEEQETLREVQLIDMSGTNYIQREKNK